MSTRNDGVGTYFALISRMHTTLFGALLLAVVAAIPGCSTHAKEGHSGSQKNTRPWLSEWNQTTSLSGLMEMITRDSPISTSELKGLAYRHVDSILKILPKHPGSLSPSDLESLSTGTYRLDGPPSFHLLKYLPKFRNESAEVGVHRIKGQWVLTVANGTQLVLEQPLKSIESTDAVEIDIHSHPGEDEDAGHPSFEDLDLLLRIASGHIYISTYVGFIALQKPVLQRDCNNLNDTPPSSANKLWSAWVREQGITEESFNQEGSWNVFDRFCRDTFHMRTIPWSEENSIKSLLR